MKFECDSCHAQYMIADEKVGKRGVKVKCKKCQHVIIVRPDKNAAPAEAKKAEDKPAKAPKPAPAVEKPVVTEMQPPPPGLDLGASPPDDDSGGDIFAQGGPTDPGVPDMRAQQERARDDDEPSPETTGPSAPAPVSLFGDATQLTKNPLDLGLPSEPEERGHDDRTELSAHAPQVTGAQAPPSPPPEDERDDGDHSDDRSDDRSDEHEPARAARGGVDTTVVTDQRAADDEDDDLPVPPPPPQSASSDEDGGLDDQLAGAFNAMFDGSATPSAEGDDHRGPTRVLDVGAMDALRKQTADSPLGFDAGPDPRELEPGLVRGPDPGSPDGADDGPAEQVWHVAIDDQDVGPLALGEVGRHIEAGRVDRESLVWKIGMEDWLPAGEVPAVRALFDKVPMPHIPRVEDDRGRAAQAGGAAAFGIDGIGDGLPPGATAAGPSPFDEPSDDASWRPHGLTDVYQAANLAEMAGMGSLGSLGAVGGPSKAPTASSSPPSSASAEPEWRPAAASALASLVQDEIKRIDNGPMPAADDDLAPADDASINAPLFGSLGAGKDLEAGPEVGAPLAPAGGALPSFNAPAVTPSYPPPGGFMTTPPQPSRMSPMMLAAGIGVGVVVLLLIVVLTVVALKKDDGPKLVQVDGKTFVMGADGKLMPLAGGGKKADDEKADDKKADDKKADADKKDATAKDDAKPDAAKPDAAKPDDAKPDAKPDEHAADAAKDKDEGGKVASADEPEHAAPSHAPVHHDTHARHPRADTSTHHTSPPPAVTASHATPKGCDPVLDFDCKASGRSESSRAADRAGSVKDSLSKADVLVVVKSHLGNVEKCGRRHSASGVIKMAWKIQARGNTTNVSVLDSKFAGTPAGNCVVSEIKRWRFPATRASSPVPVTMPMKIGP